MRTHSAPDPSGLESADGACIVVAEDDAALRAFIGQVLSERWRVELAADGDQALELTRRHLPELVLAEVMMPKLDGFELVRAIRSDSALKTTAVVLLSTRTGEQARAEARLAGADDYIPKPLSARELIALVGAQLGLTRVRREVFEQNAFRLKLSDAIRPLADPIEVRLVATRLLGEHIGVTRVMYAELDASGERMIFERCFVAPGTPEITGHFAVADFGQGILSTLLGGEMAVIDTVDSLGLSENERATYSNLQIEALIGVPLIKQGRLIGGLGVHHDEPRHWTPSELELIQETAERTWAAIERARAEAALRRSEERFRTLFDTMEEGFSVCELVRDAHGRAVDARWVEANAALERQTGMSRNAAIGRLGSEVFPDYDRTWLEDYQRVVDTGVSERFERYMPQLGRWFELTVYPYGGDRFAVLYDDVTQRKLSEEALRQSEERQAYLLKLSDAMRPLADPAEIQREACRILRAHLGGSRAVYWEAADEDSMAAAAEDVLPGNPPCVGARWRFADFGPVFGDEFRAGRMSWRDDIQGSSEFSTQQKQAHAALNINAWAAAPLVKAGNLFAAFALSFPSSHVFTPEELHLLQETAERTWAAGEQARAKAALGESEKRARALLAQAESANRAKDEFLATLSHELRTPLAAILLWAGALRSGAVPREGLAKAIEAIVQSAESQSLLVEDLLDLSRLASGKLSLSPSPIDVAGVVQTAIETVKPSAAARNIAMTAEIARDMGHASLDGVRLTQIVWNLLTNAVKFTPDGGRISLAARKPEASQLVIEVADTGEGIAPELMSHVFERFWQADMGETRRHMGLGIGLALTKELVELHGGTIEAESEGSGRGALFRVRLPWVAADPAATSTNASVRTAVPPGACPLEGLRVVLVEDDQHTREGMRWALVQGGANVIAVGTAGEALEVLERDLAATVIVSDLALPGASGFELVERIVHDCGRNGLHPPPSLAVSALARDVDRKLAIEAGFDMYLAKPIAPERLVQAVSDLRELLRAPPA